MADNNSLSQSLLIGLGLSEKEANIYSKLLQIGEASVSHIIKESGLKRGITYAVLYKLEQMGLVIQLKRSGKTHFQVTDPQNLKSMVEQKKKEIDSLHHNLDYVMPGLVSQYKLAVNKPTVRYLEGQEGIREVFEDIYAPKTEGVYGCVDLEKADEVFPSYIMDKLIPKRVKNKLFAYSLIADSDMARLVQKNDDKQLRKSVLIDKKLYPLPAEIDVYGDKIAMLSLKKDEFVGLIIENADLAQTLRSIFKLAFSTGDQKGR